MDIYSIIVGVIALLLAYTTFHFYQKTKQATTRVQYLTDTYAPILNVDQAVSDRQKIIVALDEQATKLETDYRSKYELFSALEAEVKLYETNLEDMSFGLYQPVYSFDTSWQYKNKLEAIRTEEKSLIKQNTAVLSAVEWTVGGSKVEGRKMTKQYSQLMLRAFNGECDAAVARVSWNNITVMEQRVYKAFEAINKTGSVQQCSINTAYFDLKIAELRLEYELQEKLQAEKEEQRLIREQMREEERAQRELELAQKKAQDEEDKYQKALLKAQQEVEKTSGIQLESLNLKIADLRAALESARLQKERAMSMAQLTKSGHVYIISNIGSFGEDIYKIGMTRRLEPLDRVKELGDASVPFSFDVHGLVYSDNAPELEHLIHKRLDKRRVNLMSGRREFFKVSLTEIKEIFNEKGLDLTLTELAEAREYRESENIRYAQFSQQPAPTREDRFPSTLLTE